MVLFLLPRGRAGGSVGKRPRGQSDPVRRPAPTCRSSHGHAGDRGSRRLAECPGARPSGRREPSPCPRPRPADGRPSRPVHGGSAAAPRDNRPPPRAAADGEGPLRPHGRESQTPLAGPCPKAPAAELSRRAIRRPAPWRRRRAGGPGVVQPPYIDKGMSPADTPINVWQDP
jgi:hypothetical protein